MHNIWLLDEQIGSKLSTMLFSSFSLRHCSATMGNPRIDHSILEGLYHPFLVKSGMVDCWVYHITQISVQPTGWKWWNCSCKAAVTRNSYHSCTRQIHQTKTKQRVWYEEFKASSYPSWCVKSILHLYINFNSNTDLGLRYAHALNVGWLTNEPWMQNQEQIKQVIEEQVGRGHSPHSEIKNMLCEWKMI